MAIRREAQVTAQLLEFIQNHPGSSRSSRPKPDARLSTSTSLTHGLSVQLFEAALQSRLQDLEARRLKDKGLSHYTIGSSGHEANAVWGELLNIDDPAFLHYRSGAFMAARSRKLPGETPIFDAMLSFTAAAQDPISGGRHKVLGSRSLWVPPQTSTIASHLPKAVGLAYSLARMQRLKLPCAVPEDAVVYCSFGDASANHATAQAGFTAAAAAQVHRQPCPILFVCEDNGLGISVRTPDDYIAQLFSQRPGLHYFHADGADLLQVYETAGAALEYCRLSRRPVFFHLRTTRLLGHAGSDMESSYLDKEQITAQEARDPLLGYADLLLSKGSLQKTEMLELYHDLEQRIQRAGEEASHRPKLQTAAQVMAPLALPEPSDLRPAVAEDKQRQKIFKGRLPEDEDRPRHMAYRIAQGLHDVMASYPQAFVFGEDVAKKGGVYHVTDGLHESFGGGRVFNTILDETTILGMAQGMAQAGCLPICEIQYLAYIHNALDQIRGEAASLRFFSNDQFRNPMLVRIASFAYQKGFGGHFHNDNSIGALLDIPGLIIATPSRADDAVGMLRTLAAAAVQSGSVCLFLEPIALYMQKDLHESGDGLWQFAYPKPEQAVTLGEAQVYGASREDDLTIISYANGLYLSLQAQKDLAALGIRARVLDLRWLAPLPMAQILEHSRATGRMLIVDECRQNQGGPSGLILAQCCRESFLQRRIAAKDSFIPLGPAANLLLLQKEDIVEAAVALSQEERK